MTRRAPNEETPDDRGDEKVYATPPRDELEGMNISEVCAEYDVSSEVAARWLQEHDLYEPDRQRAGCSELGKMLLEADPDDIGGSA